MHVVADLQLHSRFSRAVSPAMTIATIALWAKRKGIGLVATGDWTHPQWFREIEQQLEETGNGLLRLKQPAESGLPLFLLATEVSCIYSQGGKVRRIHTLLWVPTLAAARKINIELTRRGCNLLSDGRPIIGLTSIQVAELVFSIEPEALIIPAHAWTPWFSVYGRLGGFDRITDAFGGFAKKIYAVETGLSSNPAMNWRIAELDSRAIVSFSDAHSGPKLGREATVFRFPGGDVSYRALYEAIRSGAAPVPGRPGIAYTLEFYPEEGKYHYTGHRACHVRQTPDETRRKGATCPVCGKPLTIGVMHRVDELAGRTEQEVQQVALPGRTGDIDVVMYGSNAFPKRPPFAMLVPLMEIVAEAIGSPVSSPKVQVLYMRLINEVGNEFFVLVSAAADDIAKVAGEQVAMGVKRVRQGKLVIEPGYDGVFGMVKIREKDGSGMAGNAQEQLTLLTE